MTEYLFKLVTDFQDKNFPTATAMSKLVHLKEELQELFKAFSHELPDKKFEFADCFILLYGAAASDGMSYADINKAISSKMQINRNRKWGQPDHDGVVRHIKASGDNPINGMMCKPQPAQINCLAQNCYYNQGAGYCSHPAPEFTIVKHKAALPISTCNSFKENID